MALVERINLKLVHALYLGIQPDQGIHHVSQTKCLLGDGGYSSLMEADFNVLTRSATKNGEEERDHTDGQSQIIKYQ